MTSEEVFIFPVSFAQQRLWVLDQLNPDSPMYNLPTTLHFKEGVNIPALERAFSEVIRRHEALRTTFSIMKEQPMQVISLPARMSLPVVDLGGLSSVKRDAEARRLSHMERALPFDLARGPLLRTTLLKLGKADYLMSLTIHHIISDGWSMTILVRELNTLYLAYRKGKDLQLPELPIQYADFALWQREYLQGAQLETQLGYWRKQLAGLSVLDLPTDKIRPTIQTYQGSSVSFHCSKSITNRINELSQTEGVTLYMTLLAAFQALLSRYSGQADIAVGTAIAGRNRAETENLIGFFVNTLVMRADLSGRPTFRELLKRVREVCLGAYAHQDVPFEKLVEELQPERDLSRSPLFQVMFVLQNTPQDTRKLEGQESNSFELHSQIARFDLVLSMTPGVETLNGAFLYNTDLFYHERIERIAEHFQRLLQAITEQPEQSINRLSLLGESESEQILVGWNDTAREYPQDVCIHHLFEAQVDRTPEAIALSFQHEHLTYRELNERANQLARHLKDVGAGPEVLIGVYVERSVEMVVGLLGILKAGGAYVPLDPQYPLDRLSFMMEDAGVNVLLTQKRLLYHLPQHRGQSIVIDSEWGQIAQHGKENPDSGVEAENLAYVIYTSGSTGKPKGVMVQHQNVVNFFTAMDLLLLAERSPGVWLTITSISFDISVLELFWTLARGFKIVIQSEVYKRRPQHLINGHNYNQEDYDKLSTRPDTVDVAQVRRSRPQKSFSRIGEYQNQATRQNSISAPKFSLFYFAYDGASAPTHNRYRLLLEGARFADKHDFTAVWVPERHFHAFGGLYPNPSVAAAALATVTQKIQIRAGSVVLPLHHPVRVAEEWAIVDNLSGGRVGVSFASGWHAADFIFAPNHYQQRKQIMIEQLQEVRRLWRGEAVTYKTGSGTDVSVKIYPRPVQRELPAWLTAAGNPETFEAAGRHGCGVLTHLLGQSMAELKMKIATYRKAWAQAGHEGQGHVSLMAHAFVGDDEEHVLGLVKGPFKRYLAGSVDLMKKFKESLGIRIKGKAIEEEDMDAVLDHAFDRYYEESGLIGGVEKCVRKIEEISQAGVDEVACLVDFGVEEDAVLEALEKLWDVKNRCVNDWEKRNGVRGEINGADSNERGEARRTIEEEMETGEITHMQCTPSLARMLSMNPDSVRSLGNVNELLLGGETLPPSLLHQLRQFVKGRIHNMYGPTETTIWSSTHTIKHKENIITIGRAVANTQTYILSDELEPLPVGVRGEIYIGGAGATRGYLHDPALTAEKFIPHPFRNAAGSRLYRTGDQARHLADGNIEFLGRFDNQVKIRGYRIELGEVESVLDSHPLVRESVVVTRDQPNEEKRLIAYVVRRSEELSIVELRNYARKKLPEYMLPDAIVAVEEVPLTPNGKVDRRRLPEPGPMQANLEEHLDEASTLIEELLIKIWSRLLGVERMGVNDNFFGLGGHSLLAMQVITRIREVFKIELPLRELFEFPTVSGLSERISSLLQKGRESHVTPIVRIPRNGEIPISISQESQLIHDNWSREQSMPVQNRYNYGTLRLNGLLDVRLMELSLNEIIRRHEVLRATFRFINGRPVQTIAPTLTIILPIVDLCGLSSTFRESEVEQILSAELELGFDIESGPLIRALLLKLGEQEHVLTIIMEHLISDGRSNGILLKEMVATYAAFLMGQHSSLPELDSQYADFASWQRNLLQGKRLEELLTYWKGQLGAGPLSNVAEIELPFAKPRSQRQTYEGASSSLVMKPDLYNSMKMLCRQREVTLFMLLMATLKALLQRYASKDDITIIAPTAYRNRSEVEPLIGWFGHSLLYRTNVSGDPTFLQLLSRVRDVVIGAHAHQDLPFAQLLKSLRPGSPVPPRITKAPYISFNLAAAMPGTWRAGHMTISPVLISVKNRMSPQGISMLVTEQEDTLEITLKYGGDRFDEATINRMLFHFQNLLQSIVSDPSQRLSELELLTEEENRRLQRDMAEPGKELLCESHLHNLFERRVEQAPDAMAITFGNDSLSYAELNCQANQFATYLMRKGVTADDRVGIYLDQSAELVVGILAILKLGGTCIPLSALDSPEQLRLIMEDAQFSVLVTGSHLIQNLPDAGAKIIYIHDEWDWIARESVDNIRNEIIPGGKAFIFYDDSLDSRPKGVEVSHWEICERIKWMQQRFPLAETDRTLCLLPINHSRAVLQIFDTLLNGACLIMGAVSTRHCKGDCFVNLIGEYMVTILELTKPMKLDLLQQNGLGRCTSLKRVICSGEKFPLMMERRFLELLDAELIYIYRVSELAGDLLYRVCRRESAHPTTLCGRPIGNTRAYILDDKLRPVPTGVPGAMFVNSPSLATSHINCAEFAGVMVPDPFSAEPGSRLCRTGAIARYSTDEDIEFLGRIDEQVKAHGVRIELRRIEAAIEQHPSIIESKVLMRDVHSNNKFIVAYFVTERREIVTFNDLRAFLRHRLPHYMMPAAFIQVDSLPLTIGGKVAPDLLPPLEMEHLLAQVDVDWAEWP